MVSYNFTFYLMKIQNGGTQGAIVNSHKAVVYLYLGGAYVLSKCDTPVHIITFTN